MTDHIQRAGSVTDPVSAEPAPGPLPGAGPLFERFQTELVAVQLTLTPEQARAAFDVAMRAGTRLFPTGEKGGEP